MDGEPPQVKPETEAEKPAPEQTDEDILSEAHARYKLADDAERETRLLAAEDRRFRAGEQWPLEIKTARELDGRPCLTINKMPQFEQQVTNDQRQNRPAIKVHPVDDLADPETAKIYQGIIKHIEVASNADTARDTAFENAVRGSYGYYRVVTEYTSPESFDQEIRTKQIRDADTVLLDPNHQEPDGSDSEYGFISERISKDRYKREYGESALAKATDAEWEATCNRLPEWVKRDTVLVTEYFYKHYETKELVLLSDGQVLEKSEVEAYIAERTQQPVDELGQSAGESISSVKVVNERTSKVPTVKWCKLNGSEVLSKRDWPGKWIPILPVYGSTLVVDGKVIRESLIRHAKDPARMYNFWKSAETEAITLAPKAPFIVEEGQLEGYEHEWKEANRRNFPYLKYKAKDIQGTPLPPPQRQAIEPAVQAITQASMLAADEVKATMGLYDAALGARSNETSGVAIQRRNQQAQTSNFHFTDNLNRTIRHEGRIYTDLIPKIYDSARVARIIGEDGEQKVVKINQPYKDEIGALVKHDLSVGQYDVTIDSGPSYATRRQEAAAFMQEMVRSYPQTMQVAGDLVVKNMDVPGASDLAERFKRTLPPNLTEDPKKAKQTNPQDQAKIQQMGQILEQLTGKLHEAQDQLDQKTLELESKERIEFKKLEVQLEMKLAEIDQKDSLAILKAEIDQISSRLNLVHINQPIKQEENQPNQNFSPDPTDGDPVAESEGQPQPTGGLPPGSPMDGQLQ